MLALYIKIKKLVFLCRQVGRYMRYIYFFGFCFILLFFYILAWLINRQTYKTAKQIFIFHRKPRLNAELVAAQVAQVVPPKVKKAERKDRERKGESRNLQKGRWVTHLLS